MSRDAVNLITLKPGLCVDLYADGSVRVTQPGRGDVYHAPGSPEALELRACAGGDMALGKPTGDPVKVVRHVVTKIDRATRTVTYGEDRRRS